MRPSVTGEARRPHLMPCSRCGAANGVTAIACWQCDLQLMPEPQPVRRPAGPPPVLEHDVPVVESEVPPAMLEQIRARAAAAADHDGPRTLPPFSPPHDTITANDELFAVPPSSMARHPRLMLAVAGLTIASVLVGSLLWPSDEARVDDGRAVVAAPPADPTPPVQRAETRPAPAVAPAVAVAPPVVAATIAPPPAKIAPPPPVAEAPPKAVQQAKRSTPRPPPRNVAAVREDEQPVSPPQAVRPPPPVRGACTPEIAALALCTLAK
jgi:hypothetical protein